MYGENRTGSPRTFPPHVVPVAVSGILRVMPELPEVETIRRQLLPLLTRQRIVSARVTRSRAVRAHSSPEEFIALVSNQSIVDLRRRGKALLILLDNDSSILIRLGMSGRLSVTDAAAPPIPHTHVVITFANGSELRFIDPRTFGQMAVVAGHDPDRMLELGHYGVEPLDAAFTPQVLGELLAGTQMLIQAAMMDQTKIAGIGKIYADEACFLAGISPLRKAGSLTPDEVTRLHAAIRQVLELAIANRGTSTIDAAYRDAEGRKGGFQMQLYVYQRTRQPCRRCGTLIEHRPFQGRRMHFCPRCQH